MTEEEQQELINLRYWATGDKRSEESKAPLLCLGRRPWFGEMVSLNKSENHLHVIGMAACGVSFTTAWEERFKAVPVPMLDTEIWVYVNEDKVVDKLEDVQDLLGGWLGKLKREDAALTELL